MASGAGHRASDVAKRPSPDAVERPPSDAAEHPALAESLQALTDPTRRAVVALLARGPQRAGDLAAALGTTPPSLSRHLRVLRRSGLVEADDLVDDARVRVYRLRLESLQPLHAWLDELRGFWIDQLEAFRQHAEASTTPAPPAPPARRKGRRS